MLSLTRISLTQFKNYAFRSFDIKERIVGICGLNGQGKTNLIDAVYYSCLTKSYFSRQEGLNIQFGKDGFRIEAIFDQGGMEMKVVCISRPAGKKEITLNDVPYEKISQHIGRFPVVMIAPDDIELVTGGSEERRRFLDAALCQLDPDYLQQLIVYNRVLQQRNGALKRFAEMGKTDWALLDVLDEQLSAPGKLIFERRRRFTDELIPLVEGFYTRIAGGADHAGIRYESQLLSNSFEGLLNQYREKDFLLQRTQGGIHKDELVLELDGQPFRTTASQGQRKSLLFALRLAEFELLKNGKGFPPLLLLDDVFEKLDDNRMSQLLQWVCLENTGQVFITDTHRERLEQAFLGMGIRYQLIGL